MSDSTMTIATAEEVFFADLRLAPRSKRTYRQGVRKFIDHLSKNEGIDPETTSVADIEVRHITDFATLLLPEDVRTPEEVSAMRTAQNNLAAVRKFCGWLSAYDHHPSLPTDKIRVRLAAMMPRFTPPPPDVKLGDLDTIVEYVLNGPREEKPLLELRRLKVRAMILFMYRTGVRVSELCALRRRDIDLDDGTASIYRAKGGKSRTVHFDDETARVLTGRHAAMKLVDRVHCPRLADVIDSVFQARPLVHEQWNTSLPSCVTRSVSRAISRHTVSGMDSQRNWYGVAFARVRCKRFWGTPAHKPRGFTYINPLWMSLMNIRKPSVHTDRHRNNMTLKKPVTERRLTGVLVSLLLSLVILAGCSTGSAPEANQGKHEDAQRESVISDMQATHTWDIINGTPESTPEETEEPE